VRPIVEERTRGQAQQRYGLLLLTLLASIAVQGIGNPSDLQEIVVSILLGASLLLAVWAAGLSTRLLAAAAIVAAVVIALAVVRAATGDIGDGASRLMNALLVALGPPAVVIGGIRSLRASRQVRVEAVMAVLSLYMLIGMLFAFVFGAIENLSGDPYFTGDIPATVSRCLYFSFTTLTTVGYGDLTARTDLGHTLSVFEALIGQIYLVTVVSLIVGNLGRRGAQQRETPQATAE
jgi:hypothetical protein